MENEAEVQGQEAGEAAAPDAGAVAGFTVPKEKFEEERAKLKVAREQTTALQVERDALAAQVAELGALRQQVEELGAAKAQAADYADQLALARAGFVEADAYVVAKALHAAKAADQPFSDFIDTVAAHPSLQAFRAAPAAAAAPPRAPLQAGASVSPLSAMAIDPREAAAKARAGDPTALKALQEQAGKALAQKFGRG